MQRNGGATCRRSECVEPQSRLQTVYSVCMHVCPPGCMCIAWVHVPKAWVPATTAWVCVWLQCGCSLARSSTYLARDRRRQRCAQEAAPPLVRVRVRVLVLVLVLVLILVRVRVRVRFGFGFGFGFGFAYHRRRASRAAPRAVARVCAGAGWRGHATTRGRPTRLVRVRVKGSLLHALS